MSRMFPALIVISLVGWSAPALAALQAEDLIASGDGLVTLDTTTGLRWLDVPATAGRSWCDIRSDIGGWRGLGWRHATSAEICNLFSAYAFAPVPCPGHLELSDDNSQDPLTEPLTIFLGFTVNQVAGRGTYGFHNDETTTDPRVGWAGLVFKDDDNHSVSLVWKDNYPATDRTPGAPAGNFLVRDECLGQPDGQPCSSRYPFFENEVCTAGVCKGTSTAPDADGDGVSDSCDNCVFVPNGPGAGLAPAGSCVGACGSAFCSTGDSCSSYSYTCSTSQEDSDDDGAGDVCDSDEYECSYDADVSSAMTQQYDPPRYRWRGQVPYAETGDAPSELASGGGLCSMSIATAQVVIGYTPPPASPPPGGLACCPWETNCSIGCSSATGNHCVAGEECPTTSDIESCAESFGLCSISPMVCGPGSPCPPGEACGSTLLCPGPFCTSALEQIGAALRNGTCDDFPACCFLNGGAEAFAWGNEEGNPFSGWNLDGDRHPNACDNCACDANVDQHDEDGDGVGDACDNCITLPNAGQTDLDCDGIGDVCDPSIATLPDPDGDSVGAACDNCPGVSNADQLDVDCDGLGNTCDPVPMPEPGAATLLGAGLALLCLLAFHRHRARAFR